MRKCNKCGNEYPETYEYFRYNKSRDGSKKWLSRRCRKCDSEYTSKYCKDTQRHKLPHVKAHYKRYREGHKREIRYKYYERVFGITKEEFKAMVKMQKNGCAICEEPLKSNDKHSFNIDHCHDTGKVRGILCGKCNRGIGHFNNSEQLLKAAARYLHNQ